MRFDDTDDAVEIAVRSILVKQGRGGGVISGGDTVDIRRM